MKKLDLNILENADKDTLDALSAKYRAVGDKEAEKILRRAIGDNTDTDTEVCVHGVEVYRRPLWRKVLAAASALVLVAGAVTCGAFMMKNAGTKNVDTLNNEIHEVASEERSEETEATEEATEYVETVESVLKCKELQLHEDPLYVETMNEAKALVDEHSTVIRWEDRYKNRIDTVHYARLLQSEDYDLDSLEAKSFIYHMMLNSFLYFDTAKGKVILQYDSDSSHISNTEFQVDLNNQESYAKTTNDFSGAIWEDFVYDEKEIRTGVYTYSEYMYCKNTELSLPEDNFRHIDVAPPDLGYSVLPSCSMICDGELARDVVMPEDLAISRLMYFDNWHINGISEKLGRTVAELSGTLESGNSFTIVIDIYTGIMLGYTEYSGEDIIDMKEMVSLEVDIPVERVEFDPSEYTKAQSP